MIWLALVIAFAVFKYATTDGNHAFTGKFPSDLEVYLLGGQKVANHQPLYDSDLLPGLPFTYPPFAGVVFSWFGAPSEALAFAWMTASVVVLGWVVWASSRSKKALVPLTLFFVLCTEPVHGTLYFGQVNLFLMALVCLDFLPKNRLPGIGTGLAAGIKLTPAFFLVLFAVQRRWGAMAIAAFTFLCTVAAGMEVVDAGTFWTHSIFNTERVGVDENPGAQSIRQVLARAGVESTGVWLVLVVAVTVLAVLVCRKAPAPLAVGVMGMTACLVSPFSWYHHWVWIVPFGVWVYQRFGVAALILVMLPYAAVNVTGAHLNALYIAVPILFMIAYLLVPGKLQQHAHPSRRRRPRGRSSTDPRAVRPS